MRIDHHLLDPRASRDDLHALIAHVRAAARDEAGASRGMVVPPVFAREAIEALRGEGVRVASVVGYPLGFSKPTIKAIEATSLAKDGVDAIEVTPLAASLIDAETTALRDELLEIARGVRAARPTTTIHVRVALDSVTATNVVAIGQAIERGACDGIVLESRELDRLDAFLGGLPQSSLRCKVIGPTVDASAKHLSRIDSIGLPFLPS